MSLTTTCLGCHSNKAEFLRPLPRLRIRCTPAAGTVIHSPKREARRNDEKGVPGASRAFRLRAYRTCRIDQGAPAAEAPVKKKWAMVVDVSKCAKDDDCIDCIEACHRVHNVPDIPDPKRQVKWIWTSPFEALFPEQTAYMGEH